MGGFWRDIPFVALLFSCSQRHTQDRMPDKQVETLVVCYQLICPIR